MTIVEQQKEERRVTIQYWNLLRNISLIGACILISFGFFTAFYRAPVIEVLNEPMPMLSNSYYPGEPISFHIVFDKFTDDVAEVTPMMVGQDCPNVYLPSYISNVQVGHYDQDFTIGTIPLYAPPCTYTLRLTIEYQTSTLHRQFLTIESQPFEVLEGRAAVYFPL